MKKIILALAILCSIIGYSQDTEEKSTKQNEFSTNLLDLVVAGSFNVNYERLLNNNQSFAVNATFFDTYGYYDAGYIDKNNAFTLKASFIIYFAKNKDHAGFFFYPQAKLRMGEITTSDYYYYYVDEYSSNGEYTYDIDGFSLGFGLGHKWSFNDVFTLSINGEIARNLGNFDDNYLDPIEAKFGVNFGFRF